MDKSTPLQPVSFVVGPSHAVRWSCHIRESVVASKLKPENIIGIGGAPIWSKSLFDKALQAAERGAQVGVIVGDTRFGNAILLQEDSGGLLLRDSPIGIEAQAMSQDFDRAMLDRLMRSIAIWHQKIGKNARYVFWDLFASEVHNRLQGKYIANNAYRHPIFNYADVVGALPELNIIDLSPLLRKPMHEVSRLFIDASAHPSQIGYIFLDKVLCSEEDPTVAYQQAVDEIEKNLLSFANHIFESQKRKVILTGRSVWLDTMARHMGALGTQRLAKAGLILAPLDRAAGRPLLADVMDGIKLSECSAIIVSASGADLSSALTQTLGDALWVNVPHIDWETATHTAIRARNETPRFVYNMTKMPRAGQQFPLALDSRMVEMGPLGMPSWLGLSYLLGQIAHAAVPLLPSASSEPQIASSAAARASNMDHVNGGAISDLPGSVKVGH